MQEFSASTEELLKFAVEHGMLNMTSLYQDIQMKEREKYLEMHPFKIYQGKDLKWYTYIPDEVKGRIKKKSATKEKIEDIVIQYWKEQEFNPSVEDVFCDWVTRKKELGNISSASYDRYNIDFKKYFQKISKTKIKDITSNDIEDFVLEIIAEFNMTSKCFSNVRTLLYGIFKKAKKLGYVNFSITETIGDIEFSKNTFKKKIVDPQTQVYMSDEKALVENYLIENRDIVNLGLLFMFKTGVRVGELAAMKVSDVSDYTVFVNRTETRYKDDEGYSRYEIKDFPKSECGLRKAILPTKYEWILDEILKASTCKEYLFEKDGKRVKTYSFRRKLRYICEDILKIPVKSPHKIRKTYGTILLDERVKDSTIIQMMGHSDIKTTKDHYYYDRTTVDSKRAELDLVEGL